MISPETLRRYPHFADVGAASLREVAMMAEEEKFDAGFIIFREGDEADKAYLLTEGEVDIQYTLGTGELRTVDTIVSGELLMWSALVSPYRATGIATARTPVAGIAIDGRSLRELCERDHDLGYRLLLNISMLLAERLEGVRVQLATAD